MAEHKQVVPLVSGLPFCRLTKHQPSTKQFGLRSFVKYLQNVADGYEMRYLEILKMCEEAEDFYFYQCAFQK